MHFRVTVNTENINSTAPSIRAYLSLFLTWVRKTVLMPLISNMRMILQIIVDARYRVTTPSASWALMKRMLENTAVP